MFRNMCESCIYLRKEKSKCYGICVNVKSEYLGFIRYDEDVACKRKKKQKEDKEES